MKHHTPLSPWRFWLGVTCAALSLPPVLQAADPLPVTQTKDKVQARVGTFLGGALYSADGAGHTSKPGDYAVDFGQGNGPVLVSDGAFLNTAAENDEMTFSFWIRNSDLAGNSAFWAYSPTTGSGGRGFQAHVPWSDNSIYFDTAGCCDGATQRITGSVGDFPDYSGEPTWWTENWRFLVFSKKGEVKQVWIDGVLFLEGTSTAPLPKDFTQLFIGSESLTASRVHGLMDDFAVFGTALTEVAIGQLFAGTSPSALPGGNQLLAYWDFNDYPAAGEFISVTPAPDAPTAAPDLIQVVHVDGTTAWDQNNVSLKVDEAPVAVVLSRDGKRVTVMHVPSPLLSMQSRHRAALTYPGVNGPETLEWEFTVGPYTKDLVASRIGVFTGGASFSSSGLGRTGQTGDSAVDFGMGTGPVRIADGSFLNTASAGDEMTFAFWMKGYDNANNSAFWAVAPSSPGGRGWQAHVPNGNIIYFDTAGCCDAATQRINANIDTFLSYTGDVSWWQDWHHFVFSKQGEIKQVWIDGQLFLEGSNTAPLPSDFTELFLGSDASGAGVIHGLVDDFAVFGKALDEATIGQLFGGTAPGALPASNELAAFWNFNDVTPEGLFVSLTPGPESTNAVPNLVEVVHLNGTSPWELSLVSLKVDNVPVTASVTREGSQVTVRYIPSPIFAPNSSHTATLSYPQGGAQLERSWQFTVGMYSQDVIHDYLGVLTGPAKFTPDGGGQSGQPGDYAIDLGAINAAQSVHILDASFLNAAAANDEITLVAWQKLYQIADSALFWVVSPSSNGSQRGIGTHAPWSNNNLYFDTAGCCDAATQRTTAAMSTDTFPDYSGTVDWWNSWHHMVFLKRASVKEIWIDGKLFTVGDNTSVLPSDFTTAYLGYNPADGATMRGLVDEAAMFKTALSEADIVRLAGGAAPNTLPASAGILAYWNFNDASLPVVTPQISISGVGVITYTGTLESSATVNGGYATVAGASSPYTAPKTGAAMFYRAKQ